MPLMLNKCHIGGNLTRDPETRMVGDDKCVCSFGIAVNRKYTTGGGEQKEEVLFLDCEVWGRQAELCSQYIHKGSNVLVEGSLKLDQWEKDGKKNSKIKLVGQRVHFIGKLDPDGRGNSDHQQNAGNYNSNAPVEDEPPF